jgi:hypothetical protein
VCSRKFQYWVGVRTPRPPAKMPLMEVSDEEEPYAEFVLPHINEECVRKRKSIDRYNATREFLLPGDGMIVKVDEFGEWRQVPGFPDTVHVSSMGYVSTLLNGNRITRKGTISGNGYPTFGLEGYDYRVHTLVCRAFHGHQPSKEASVDHVAKYDGDWKRERADNRAENLRWSTCAEQTSNTKPHDTRCTSKAVFVSHIDWDRFTPRMWFSSVGAADKALGVQNLSKVANGKHTNSKGWVATFVPPDETQEDLPGERWVEVDARVWVSNMGRAHVKETRGSGWKYRHTPRATSGEAYATLFVKGAHTRMHRTVFFAFGGVLLPGQTVDHINRDRQNNRLSNLRAAYPNVQNDNRDTKEIADREDCKKMPILFSSEDEGAWEWVESMKAAAVLLNKRHPERNFNQGTISNILKGKHLTSQGYRFRFA